eukprot:8979285-Alexandrium_andersonii.AAC.1
MAWDRNKLYVEATQGHSRGVSDNIDMPQALQVIKPGDPDWVSVGLHGTKEQVVPSILREGLDT